MVKKINNRLISKIILNALKEDIGQGDITTLVTIPKSKIIYGEFLSKESGIASGLDIAKRVFELLNKNIEFKIFVKNGDSIKKGQILASIKGKGQVILAGERTALNFLQRMSGIATKTRKYVDTVNKTKAIILDTRKTAPGLRIFDKMAVLAGSGQNHRSGLFDMFLIKDNHIVASGSITKAFEKIKKINKKILVEIEVKNLDELKEALNLKPNLIMLDNMNLAQIKKAVKLVNKKVPLEASGGVNSKNVLQIAKTGIDYISVGALTHSVKALDISLEIKDYE
ncbi:MAG: carboxylating nicotinate-nucleotide diphosphorylase [Patescibacteria group bacterium]|nr:carboxylating nicotinate-nucleotide diphosphorylase [Patescibacteria group bacterium]